MLPLFREEPRGQCSRGGEEGQGWRSGESRKDEEKALQCLLGPKQQGLTSNEKAAGEESGADKVQDGTCILMGLSGSSID